jgi:serine/threonine protein kinase
MASLSISAEMASNSASSGDFSPSPRPFRGRVIHEEAERPVWREFDPSEIEIGEVIAIGGEAKVFRCRVTLEGGVKAGFACKVFRGVHVERELEILSEIPRSRFIVALLGASRLPTLRGESGKTEVSDDSRVLVMEYFDRSLEVHLEKRRLEVSDDRDEWFQPDELALIAHDVLLGLRHLHEYGIVHRDVKPANILLETCGVGPTAVRACVSDFGVSSLQKSAVAGGVGTELYWAPEAADETKTHHPRAADVFSFGIVVFELFSGLETTASTERAAADGLPMDLHPQLLEDADSFGGSVAMLVHGLIERHCIQRCLSQEPLQRPTFVDLASELISSGPADGEIREPEETSIVGAELRVGALPLPSDSQEIGSESHDEMRKIDLGEAYHLSVRYAVVELDQASQALEARKPSGDGLSWRVLANTRAVQPEGDPGLVCFEQLGGRGGRPGTCLDEIYFEPVPGNSKSVAARASEWIQAVSDFIAGMDNVPAGESVCVSVSSGELSKVASGIDALLRAGWSLFKCRAGSVVMTFVRCASGSGGLPEAIEMFGENLQRVHHTTRLGVTDSRRIVEVVSGKLSHSAEYVLPLDFDLLRLWDAMPASMRIDRCHCEAGGVRITFLSDGPAPDAWLHDCMRSGLMVDPEGETDDWAGNQSLLSTRTSDVPEQLVGATKLTGEFL